MLYGVLYFNGLFFYGQFGVDPAEVGFTRDAALAHAAFGLLAILMVLPLLLLSPPILLLVLLLWHKRRSVTHHLRGHTRVLRWAALSSILFFPTALLVSAILFVGSVAQSIIKDDYHPDTILVLRNVTGISVTFGDAVWTVPTSTGQSVHRSRIALLGQPTGAAIFYDYSSKQVQHVPSGSFTFTHEVLAP